MTRIAEVVSELTSCHGRTGSRLDRDELRRLLTFELVSHEGSHDAAEVGSAACASDNDIGILVDLLHLKLSLFTDDGLVKHYLVKNGTQYIAVTFRRCCNFNCL